jgi:hypothetical protein
VQPDDVDPIHRGDPDDVIICRLVRGLVTPDALRQLRGTGKR